MEDKTQDEINLEQFVSLLDTALMSDNPAVQNALRNLLTIATLVTAQKPGEELAHGPLRSLVETVKNLQVRVNQLEQVQYRQQPYPGTQPYNPNQRWYTGPGTSGSPAPMWGSTWSVGDDINYKGPSATMINEMLARLERDDS